MELHNYLASQRRGHLHECLANERFARESLELHDDRAVEIQVQLHRYLANQHHEQIHDCLANERLELLLPASTFSHCV